MSLPISKYAAATLLLASLAGCGGDGAASLAQAEKDAGDHAARNGNIVCALAGSDIFERTCTTEQIAAPDGKMLVIRHPDGGFRRFNILTDGRGLAPADGFDETRIRVLGTNMIELSSGDDKYRLPAQIKGQGNASENSARKDAG
jgi:predicted small lipoprotein YifL